MSEAAGVEIRSPHEAMVEHGAESDGLAQRVALTTAILATVGALFGFQSGELQSEAMLLKNDSITQITKATDAWNQYQAKSIREAIAGSMAQLATDDKKKKDFLDKEKKYKGEKEKISVDALRFQADAATLSRESERQIPSHQNMALGVTLMQVAVALASITVLTRKQWLYYGALAFAVGGVGFAAYGYFVRSYPTQTIAEHVLEHTHAHGADAEPADSEPKAERAKPAGAH